MRCEAQIARFWLGSGAEFPRAYECIPKRVVSTGVEYRIVSLLSILLNFPAKGKRSLAVGNP